MRKLKVTVRDSRSRTEKKFRVTGKGKTALVREAFGGSVRQSTEWLVWFDDVGHVIDLLISASASLGQDVGEEIVIEVDASYTFSYDY